MFPASLWAQETLFLDYDFSDEAQHYFNSQKFNPLPEIEDKKEYTIKHHQKEIKTNTKIDIAPINESTKSRYELPAEDADTQNVLRGSIITVPAGTPLMITFDAGISSESLEKADRLIAVLTEDWVYRGLLLAPAGSLVYGIAEKADHATYAYGSGSMEFTFNQILPQSGNPIQIETEKIYVKTNSTRTLNMTKDVLIGTGIGILTGLLFSAIGGFDDVGKNMLIYGGIGAAGGGIRGVTQKGIDVDIPDGTNIQIRLLNPINISPYI